MVNLLGGCRIYVIKMGEEPYKLEHVFVMAQGNAEQKNPAIVTAPNSLYTDERIMIEMSMFRDGLKENVSYTEYTENQLKSKTTNTSSDMVNGVNVNEGVPNTKTYMLLMRIIME